MPSFEGKSWKIVAVAALAVVAMGSLASSVVLATGNGRDTNNCVHACNVLRDDCISLCPGTCDIYYTPGTPEYDTCIASCEDNCKVQMQLCKSKCNAGKGHVSPNEP